MSALHLRARHDLHLLQGAKELFQAMVHAIEHSKHEVRLETYIFAFDEQGRAVAAALERAALRGVQRAVPVHQFASASAGHAAGGCASSSNCSSATMR